MLRSWIASWYGNSSLHFLRNLHTVFIVAALIYVVPEWSSGFAYFLQFKSEFGNKEFIIWARVSSQSCFCWWYRTSPSLAAKNIINLISVLTIWWCLFVESSPVCWKRVFPMTSVFSCQKLLAFALLHFALQGQTCQLSHVIFGFLLLHLNPLWWKEHS